GPCTASALFPSATLSRCHVVAEEHGEPAVALTGRAIQSAGKVARAEPRQAHQSAEPVEHGQVARRDALVPHRLLLRLQARALPLDRKSTRLNSSHVKSSY